jgi:hypothetical protein
LLEMLIVCILVLFAVYVRYFHQWNHHHPSNQNDFLFKVLLLIIKTHYFHHHHLNEYFVFVFNYCHAYECEIL